MTVPLATSTEVPNSGPSREEDLAAALEQQRVDDGDNPWVVHVLGVHNDGHYRGRRSRRIPTVPRASCYGCR